MISLPPQEALPELGQDERLGRSIVASRAAKKARTKGVIIRDVFLEAEQAPSVSVDRMDHATLHDMAVLARERARNRTPPQKLHGWAVIAVRDAASSERTVEATPQPDNIYHADIFLNIVGDELRDQQKEHATGLAARSRWYCQVDERRA